MNILIFGYICSQEHICTMHIMVCKEKMVYMGHFEYCLMKENQSHFNTTMIGVSSSTIGITIAANNNLLVSHQFLLCGLESLRYHSF